MERSDERLNLGLCVRSQIAPAMELLRDDSLEVIGVFCDGCIVLRVESELDVANTEREALPEAERNIRITPNKAGRAEEVVPCIRPEWCARFKPACRERTIERNDRSCRNPSTCERRAPVCRCGSRQRG